MHELQVLMLGHRSVGKTSLLTAMYDQFDNDIGNINLQLTPDEESEMLLDSKLQQLKGWLANFKLVGGIEGTEDFESYRFGLGARGKNPSLNICFWDYNGGFLSSKTQQEEKGRVKKLLRECTAVVIAIDAPALMEKKGCWHEYLNRSGNITNLFKAAYSDLDFSSTGSLFTSEVRKIHAGYS
jgi:GTPase SAR1 family protein